MYGNLVVDGPKLCIDVAKVKVLKLDNRWSTSHLSLAQLGLQQVYIYMYIQRCVIVCNGTHSQVRVIIESNSLSYRDIKSQ